jgi:predicted enzyme related to lactoylglutathione lyase
MSGPQIGPVFAFSAKHAATAGFYSDVVGLAPGRSDASSSWLNTEHADLVFNAPDDRDTPAEVRGQSSFVVWFGVDDIRAVHERARKAGAVVGEFYGDYFFARDPEGRYIGIHVNEEHAHGHDHDHPH